MTEPRDQEQYEAPTIAEREKIDTPLVAALASEEPTISAAFHPADAYEPPAIVERDEIDTPLVAFGSDVVCAATH